MFYMRSVFLCLKKHDKSIHFKIKMGLDKVTRPGMSCGH